jgi:chorismate mutase
MTTVRAIRGAVQVDHDDSALIAEHTTELLREVLRRNELDVDGFISIVFTMTPDLAGGFPADAARALGFVDVPMLCATEIGVPGSLPRVIRLLAHVQTERPRSAVAHVYLRGAAALRPDLAA